MKDLSARSGNTTAFAWMGDAVYEQYIREHLLRKFGSPHADKLNWLAIEYVRADGQAACAKEMLDSGFLTEEESALLKRGRNHTSTSKPRGASPMAYKMATGFEAVVGWLYLSGNKARLEEVIAEAIRIIEESYE